MLSPIDDWQFLEPNIKAQLADLEPGILEVAKGSFKHKHACSIQGTCYVVHTLETALWAFFHATSFREGALMAADLGDDADTTAAIYGQLAGVYFAEQGIPEEWCQKLALVDEIANFAEKLWIAAWQLLPR